MAEDDDRKTPYDSRAKPISMAQLPLDSRGGGEGGVEGQKRGRWGRAWTRGVRRRGGALLTPEKVVMRILATRSLMSKSRESHGESTRQSPVTKEPWMVTPPTRPGPPCSGDLPCHMEIPPDNASVQLGGGGWGGGGDISRPCH